MTLTTRVLFSTVGKVVVQEFNKQRNMQMCDICYLVKYIMPLWPPRITINYLILKDTNSLLAGILFISHYTATWFLEGKSSKMFEEKKEGVMWIKFSLTVLNVNFVCVGGYSWLFGEPCIPGEQSWGSHMWHVPPTL